MRTVAVKDGDYYRWSHKSLAEYFAAQYICTEGKSQQAQVLAAFLNSKQLNRFSNVLDQIYDVDSAGFRTHLILPLAREFSTYWSTSYKGFGSEVTAEEIRLRKSVSFDRTILIMKATPVDFSDLEKSISVALKEATGQSLESDSIGLAAMLFSMGKSDRRMIVVVNGTFTTILEILESKKDPLIISKAKIDLTGLSGGLKIRDREKSFVVGEDPASDYNNQVNFDRLTKILAQYGSIINSDKMLAFEASFKDAVRLEELTDDLLQPIVSASRPR